MKNQLEVLFANWIDPKKRDIAYLNQVYSMVFKKELDKCPKCRTKAIEELRKYYHLTFNQPKANPERKYILKPGDHYFVAGDTGHNNDNTTDKLLEWYLKNYPYIEPLFTKIPE